MCFFDPFKIISIMSIGSDELTGTTTWPFVSRTWHVYEARVGEGAQAGSLDHR